MLTIFEYSNVNLFMGSLETHQMDDRPGLVVRYKDLITRFFFCLITTHIIIMMGRDFNAWEAFGKKSYYVVLLINFAISMGLAWYIREVTAWLDRHLGWQHKPFLRGVIQLMLGVVITAATAFYSVYLQFRVFGTTIWQSTYPDYEFKFVVSLILLVNLYYIAYYHRVQLLHLVENTNGGNETEHAGARAREYFMIETPIRNIPIRKSEIAYAFIKDGACFLCLLQMQNVQQAHLLPKTLRELEMELDPDQFFRINRQTIVNLDAIRSFGYGKGRKLELLLHPPPFENNINDTPEIYTRICTVSEDRVQAFREWIDR